ncbi:MAG: hypothetical protein ACP5IT_12435 [Thermoproteota archaeon]|jgi:predicted transcriptional regulator
MKNMDEATSIRIDADLWRKAKILAAKRGVTLRSIIEELLAMEIEAEELLGEKVTVDESAVEALLKERKKGKMPFVIVSKKTAVELVREGRGD